MKIIKRKIPSTNYDTTRKPIKEVVIHWFGAGTLASADRRFSYEGSQVSAHYGISDDTIYQWVDEDHTAYAVGNYKRNQETISIEHDATTTKNASEKTYQTSGKLVSEICKRHNIPIDRDHIIGHNEISATQCPGTLKIDKIINLAKGGIMDWLEKDIPTEVEEKFNLKKIKRYSKYWSFEQLIEDWIKIVKEFEDVESSYENALAELTEQVEEGTRQYNILLSDKNALETKLGACERIVVEIKEKYDLDISLLEQQAQDISNQYDSLLEKYDNLTNEIDEGYSEQIKRLKATITDQERRILQLQRPQPGVGEAFEMLINALKGVLIK